MTDAHTVTSRTTGRLIHRALGYDLLVWFFMRGREGRFRQRVLNLARVTRGESVLDIGCGTGTLAIAAWRRVNPGAVHGIDASPEMIARAKMKARRAGASVDFRIGAVESLPWPDATFDLVLSTVMLHHLPGPARAQCAAEVARVLKPGGRALAVDFGRSQGHGLIAHLHKHGGVELSDMIELFCAAGLEVSESGMVGVRNLHYVMAVRAAGTGRSRAMEDGSTGVRFHGVRYQVKDVVRSIAFYRDNLGFTVEHQRAPAFATLSLGELDLLLSGPQASGSRVMPDGRKQEPGGWNRVVLAVTDLPTWIDKLKRAGVKFRNDMETGPAGRQIQLEDPDGNAIELFEPAK